MSKTIDLAKHKLVDDGNGFSICLNCGWSTSYLLKYSGKVPECKKKNDL